MSYGLVHVTIKDRTEATKLDLELLQESSRKQALKILLEELDDEYQLVIAGFNTGGVSARVLYIY